MSTMPAPVADADSTPTFPIRTVCGLTGINPMTLRAWERRYGLLRPQRTAGGHRVYTRADIDTLLQVRALVGGGMAIGQVQQVLAAQPVADVSAGPWAGYREALAAAVAQFDEARLEDVYNEMLSLHPADRVTHEVLLPLLGELGRRWAATPGGIAEEHFFAVYLRNKLGARFHHRSRGAAGPKLLVACLPGEQHEIGALLFALAAHERGHRLVLLGASLPLPELAIAVQRAQADAIVLSGSVEPEPIVLAVGLPGLVRETGLPVFVGGHTSVRHHDALRAAGVLPLGLDIPAAVEQLGTVLAARPRQREADPPSPAKGSR